ncbi:MAG: hypothetical protein ACLQU9_10300 [Acidimicrobiales bacterium]
MIEHVGGPASLPAYVMRSDWAHQREVPGAEAAWAHNGIVVTTRGELIGFHAGQLVAFDQEGNVVRVVRPGLTEGHGITLVREGDRELLWVTDPGFVFLTNDGDGDDEWATLFGKGVLRESRAPRVVKMTLDGEILFELPLPPTDADASPGIMGQYCPCGSAIDEERFGGTGDVWVADGYGSSVVHRFDKEGRHLLALTGDEGGGRFLCPHAVFINRRPDNPPELYVADRENRRVQIFDLDGRYLRTIGTPFLSSPSGFARWGEFLVIAELYSRLALLDSDDELVGYIGGDEVAREDHGWPARPGWPNALDDQGRAQAPDPALPERLNSPHSVTVDADGNLYISEWLIGGRYSKLALIRGGNV